MCLSYHSFDDSHLIVPTNLFRYDPLSSCLVDFKGRACMASIKNFQLVESSPLRVRAQRGGAGGNSYFQRSVEPTEEQEREVVFLQLGKVGGCMTVVRLCICLMRSPFRRRRRSSALIWTIATLSPWCRPLLSPYPGESSSFPRILNVLPQV